MSRNTRALIILAGCLVLALDLVTLGYAFTRGGGMHLPKFPGRIAVRDGCGVQHMYPDGTDKRTMCLQDVFDDVSVSRNGDRIAWDTKLADAIVNSRVDGSDVVEAPVPLGFNAVPTLAPDGKEVAFLHSPRDDGNYDIWTSSIDLDDAQQVTNTRNVSDAAWSPRGDWIAYVQNWSDETEEGQISLVRPSGDDPHVLLVEGDAPDWSPDGKKLVYVHGGALWVVDSDGTDARQVIANGHEPAWSRDGKMIAFLRTERCSQNICPERLMVAFANGAEPRDVGPVYPEQRRVVWLPDPFE
jgi:Tol biopolymer transport system component